MLTPRLIDILIFAGKVWYTCHHSLAEVIKVGIDLQKTLYYKMK